MLVARVDSSGDFYQYFHDGLGSITMIVDSTGEYQNLYTYDDFGDFRKKDESVSNSYCYTGQERDEEPSGLYNLRARYYAAGIGRFTQEDPIMAVLDAERLQEFNGYTYVSNNPINFIDPFGLCKQKQEDCRQVFLDCMLKYSLGVDIESIVGFGQGMQQYFITRAWQHAANRSLTVPLRSSIVRRWLSRGATAAYWTNVAALAAIIAIEEYCIFKEMECLQDNADAVLDETYKNAF